MTSPNTVPSDTSLGSLMRMPSISVTVCPCSAPRMLTVVVCPIPPVRLTTSEGISFSTSPSMTVCCVFRSSAEMTLIDAPVFSAGCSVRVAVTTTVSTVSGDAAALETSSAVSAAPDSNDFCMTFSWLVPEAGTRQRRTIWKKRLTLIRAPRRRLHMSSRRFPPQSPSHPGRKQDDGARQVSWLPVHRSPSAFPRIDLSGLWTVRSPVTVAGAAAVLHRVP